MNKNEWYDLMNECKEDMLNDFQNKRSANSLHSSRELMIGIVFSYVKRFEQSQICGVVFQYNTLDFDAFVDFVLPLREVFLHGGVIIVQVFSHTIEDKARSAPDVMLVAVVACDLVNSIA